MLAASSSEQKRVLELFDLALRLVQRSGPITLQLSPSGSVSRCLRPCCRSGFALRLPYRKL
jgi:hypothetical protein